MSSYKFLLASLVPVGIYTLHGISRSNGLFAQLTSACEQKVLTDTTTTWPTWLQKSPDIAGFLVSFFWPLATGSHVTGALNSLAFVGSSFAMWVVIMIEAGRGGVRGSLVSYITLYGLLFQLAGIGVIGPAYLALNLYLTPNSSDHPKRSNIAIPDLAYLRAIPYALLTGSILPTLAATLPSPSLISTNTKLAALVFWQAFPLWTSISTSLFKSLFPTDLALPPDGKAQLPFLRKAYSLGLVLGVITHISVLTISLTSVLAPSLFKSELLKDLNLAKIFLPTLATDRVESVGEGALKFLQWDYAIISLAQIFWAVAQTRKVERKGLGFSVGNVWVDAVVRSAVFGPLGAALTIVWERDEVVLGETGGKKA
ncbi:uncharacterized protein MYCFIDRAFT_49785 [Pseudocercospora fijiensis CIRAD86]|uniref:Uncharacterized protein n=1 Tax=Pseudocercospora fijiensis (strain CIRAD86) TaxID=383855 RepID=M3ARP3_PSEFD|nr:uncharacterized protein MYCFIDRAFT_49785 [Pseudocercospora fijiensis CIRAD86]EME80112.1 hypothetical protein MYCFIDRAFT_49785 [Pseudocercospora fijiensis CIRAD86]